MSDLSNAIKQLNAVNSYLRGQGGVRSEETAVVAFSKVEYLGSDEAEHNQDTVFVRNVESFPHSTEGLKLGYYSTAGEEFYFSVDPMTFDKFRRALAGCSSKTPEEIWDDLDNNKDVAFFEIIEFPDRGAAIGPNPCAKLAEDFDDPNSRELMATAGFGDLFDNFRTAFHLATEAGIVVVMSNEMFAGAYLPDRFRDQFWGTPRALEAVS